MAETATPDEAAKRRALGDAAQPVAATTAAVPTSSGPPPVTRRPDASKTTAELKELAMANAEDIITKNREQSAAFQEAMKAADVGTRIDRGIK